LRRLLTAPAFAGVAAVSNCVPRIPGRLIVLQDDVRMSTLEADLERARAAYAERSWLEAREAFARADEVEPLAPEDLELRATTARMLARDDEAVELLERAHHAYVERGEVVRAAYCAGWIGMSLSYHGAVGPAAGWFARAQRLLENVPGETAVHGYALLPVMFRHEAAGELRGHLDEKDARRDRDAGKVIGKERVRKISRSKSDGVPARIQLENFFQEQPAHGDH